MQDPHNNATSWKNVIKTTENIGKFIQGKNGILDKLVLDALKKNSSAAEFMLKLVNKIKGKYDVRNAKLNQDAQKAGITPIIDVEVKNPKTGRWEAKTMNYEQFFGDSHIGEGIDSLVRMNTAAVLGARILPFISNITQSFMTIAGAPFKGVAAKDIANAFTTTVKYMKDKPLRKQAEYAKHAVFPDSEFHYIMRRHLSNKEMTWVDKAMNILLKNMEWSETFNRAFTYEAYKNAMRRVQEPVKNARKVASQAMTETQFKYDTLQHPFFLMTPEGRGIFTFTQFLVKQIKFLKRLALEENEGLAQMNKILSRGESLDNVFLRSNNGQKAQLFKWFIYSTLIMSFLNLATNNATYNADPRRAFDINPSRSAILYNTYKTGANLFNGDLEAAVKNAMLIGVPGAKASIKAYNHVKRQNFDTGKDNINHV
jgi:hypothetical protein